MRSLILLLVVMGFQSGVHAQAGPAAINFNGVLTQPNGQPVVSNSVHFKLEVWDKNATCLLYTEQHLSQDLSNTKGGFYLELGSGTSISNYINSSSSLSSQVFKNSGAVAGGWTGCPSGATLAAGDGRLLRVYFDVGGGFAAFTPDFPVTSVPYAMVAENLQGKSAVDFVQVRDDANYDLNQTNVENVFSAVNYPRLLQLLTPSASVGFGGQRITNIADPTSAQDATTKNYVDTRVAGLAIDLQDVAPGNGQGKILAWDAAQAKWVATAAGTTDITKLPLTGGTLTGSLNMGNNAISNISRITVGGTTPAAGAAVDINGLGAALSSIIVPRDTTAARPTAGVDGMLRYNTTLARFEGYEGGAWVTLANEANVGDFRADGSVTMTGGLKMGGQTILGNAIANGNLILDSTSNATKGSIVLGPGGSKVGIGTASPANVLDIVQNSSTAAVAQLANTSGTAGAKTMYVASNGTKLVLVGMMSTGYAPSGAYQPSGAIVDANGQAGMAIAASDTSGTGNLRFYTGGNADGNERMRITYAGNVGIGTVTPESALDIRGTNTDVQLSVVNNNSATGRFPRIRAGNFMGSYPGYPMFVLSNSRGTSTTPTAILAGDILGEVVAMGETGSGPQSGASINFMAAANFSGSDKSSSINFRTTMGIAAPADRMTISPSGKVGIGTVSPAATLHVLGDIVGGFQSATGSTVDFKNGNMIELTAPSSSITLQNMVPGGKYTLIISDVTSRTYTFTGCSSAYYSPANAATTATTRTIYNISYTGPACYIDWKSNYN